MKAIGHGKNLLESKRIEETKDELFFITNFKLICTNYWEVGTRGKNPNTLTQGFRLKPLCESQESLPSLFRGKKHVIF